MNYRISCSESGNIPIVIVSSNLEYGKALINNIFINFNEMGLVFAELESADHAKQKSVTTSDSYNLDELESLFWLLRQSDEENKLLIIGLSFDKENFKSEFEVSVDPKFEKSSIAIIPLNMASEMARYKTVLNSKNWDKSYIKKFHNPKSGIIGLQLNISKNLLEDSKRINEHSETKFQEIFRYMIFSLAGTVSVLD